MENVSSWNSIVQKIDSDIEHKEEYKELFSLIFTAYCSELEKNNDHAEVLKCFETALKFYGQDSNILVDLGSFFVKFNRDEEAKEIFRQAYTNDQKNLRAYQSLENIKSKIPRWHFKMLNDEARNEAYRKAIKYWIQEEGKVDVIDIGTGSALLSLYAAECGNVNKITAIESDPVMSEIAMKVVNENGLSDKIEIINKNSVDIEIGKDIQSKASLIFSEILDCGAFGEGILDTFIHGKENFLKPDGKIVPHKVVINIAGYNCKSLCKNHILLNETFNEYIFLDKYRLIGENSEPYDAEYVHNIADFRLITTTCDPLEVNFNSIKSMNQHFDGIIMKNFQLQSDVNDYLDGFVVWFDLYLNENDPSNVISTRSNSCWNQAIFKLRERVLLQKYEIIKLTISCRDGILKVDHTLDQHLDTIDVQVDPYVIQFINDEDYLEAIEYAANEYKENIVKNCLDLSPFPYIGFLMLKESRAEYLWCSEKNEKILKLLASKNCIDCEKIVFVNEDEFFDCTLNARFELIILNPFHELGDLNSKVCNNFVLYQKLLSNDKSVLIPYKVSLFGEMINSDWLTSSCRVVNENIKKLKIDKYINEYSTEIFLDIEHLNEYEKLTDEFRIANIVMNDEYHEKTVKPLMRNINLPCTAILLFFKIQMTMRTNREFSTQRSGRNSFFRKFAYILPSEKYISNAYAKIFFQQNYGIIKIGCE